MSPSQAAGGDGSRQQAAPNRSHKPPERPRGGKSRRTLIESACTACQKRKSRCDGTRPSCSRCQALHTECGYNAEEGESRWSALRRRNRTLERERDEARDLIAQIQSRSTPEAHELVHHLRTNPQASDLGTFIHDAVSAMSDHASPQQQQLQQVQGESGPPAQSLYYGQQSTQPYQPQQFQQTAQPHPQQQRSAQRNDQDVFSQPNYALTAAGPQLPPIRSIVDVPAGSHNSSHLSQPFPHMTQRNMSLESNMSSTSYSSPSSSDGIGGQPLSPMEHPHSS